MSVLGIRVLANLRCTLHGQRTCQGLDPITTFLRLGNWRETQFGRRIRTPGTFSTVVMNLQSSSYVICNLVHGFVNNLASRTARGPVCMGQI
jgi:hypothetical protein